MMLKKDKKKKRMFLGYLPLFLAKRLEGKE